MQLATQTSVSQQPIDINRLLQYPLDEIASQLKPFGIEVKPTGLPDTYILKFNPTTPYDVRYAHLKGLVFHHPSGIVLTLTHPIPMDIKSKTNFPQEVIEKADQLIIQPILDGTLIRLSFCKVSKRWIISTNSKLDASQAFWRNEERTFDILFQEALAHNDMSIDYNILDPRYVYLFWLQHPDNQLVCPMDKSAVYLLSIISHVNYREQFDRYGKSVLGLNNISWHPTCQVTVQEALEVVDRPITDDMITGPVTSAGYTIIDTTNGRRYRLEDPLYSYARRLLGNCNWIEVTILQHLITKYNGTPTDLQDFQVFYPQYVEEVKRMQVALSKLVNKVHQCYLNRFILQKRYRYPDYLHITLQKLDQVWKEYSQDDNPRFTKRFVKDYLMELCPRQLRAIIAKMSNDQAKASSASASSASSSSKRRRRRKNSPKKNKN